MHEPVGGLKVFDLACPTPIVNRSLDVNVNECGRTNGPLSKQVGLRPARMGVKSMKNWKAVARLATATAFIAVTTAAHAASPYGNWLRPSTGGEIRAFKCGGGLGLKVTKSSKSSNVGQTIMCGAKSKGNGRYEGNIKNLDDGQTYSGIVQVNGNALKLSGCVLGGIICKTDTWKRK